MVSLIYPGSILLKFLVSSGLAAVASASNLQVLEVASKSLRLSWEPSVGEATGYKVQMIPMTATEDGSSRRQELYVGPGQTSLVVRDLSPDVEYQVNLFALKGLTPSEPLTLLQKTHPVKISMGENHLLLPLLVFLFIAHTMLVHTYIYYFFSFFSTS